MLGLWHEELAKKSRDKCVEVMDREKEEDSMCRGEQTKWGDWVWVTVPYIPKCILSGEKGQVV